MYFFFIEKVTFKFKSDELVSFTYIQTYIFFFSFWLYICPCILKLSECVNFCFYKPEIIQILMCVKNLFHTAVVSSNNVNNF